MSWGDVFAGGVDLYEGKRNRDMQKDFAKHGIRWRVQDGLKAGVHPLYAIGANVPSFSPVMSGAGDDFGNAVDDAVDVISGKTSEERALRQAQLAVLQSQIGENDARADYFRSEAARNKQAALASTPVPGSIGSLIPGQVKGKPDEQISTAINDSSVTAGTHAGMREYTITPTGLKIRLPYSEEGPGESLENIAWWMWPVIIQHNRAYYGDDWGQRFMDEFMTAQPPSSVGGRVGYSSSRHARGGQAVRGVFGSHNLR